MKFIPHLIVAAILLVASKPIQAQEVSPRTGNMPKQQIITYTEFNKLPAEIQVIMKNNPNLYKLQVKPEPIATAISIDEYEKLTVGKQNFIKQHPELYQVKNIPNSIRKK
jgi:hypothetical protein